MTTEERITVERLREVLHYDPLTGLFKWRSSRRKCIPGQTAGTTRKNSYVIIRVDYVQYYAHRLAWLYMNGRLPVEQIDHINRVKNDNRWANLREATQKQNGENRPPIIGTRSGVTGVTKHLRDNLWVARITHNRKKITLGYFKTIEEATACRRRAEAELFTHSTT